jgi:polar amino acid transport system permease protein
MRGTPLLLQLIFLYDLLPQVGVVLSALITAIIGFGLNETAFVGEIIRGGLLSVHDDQKLAADSLGMSAATKLRRIVLPQALRAILPSLGNESISLLKATSLGSVIALNELTLRAENVVSANFQFYRVFIFAGILYLAMTSVLGMGQRLLESHYSLDRPRGNRRPGLPLRRMVGWNLPNLNTGASDSGYRQFRDRGVAAVRGLVGTRGEDRSRTVVGPSPAESEVQAVVDGFRPVDLAGGADFVVCSDVWKAYNSTEPVLQGIGLSVGVGQVAVVMGRSGSGKSTLLRLINHLEELDRGEITVGGSYVGYQRVAAGLKPVRHLARARADARIGMVFQQHNVFEHLTALENVTIAPMRVYGVRREVAEAEARAHLERMGLTHKANVLPRALSGGQRQRLGIARALAIHPRLILFDEPTSALDPELVGEVLAAIRELARIGMTMIIVTHEVRFARDVADRVTFIDEGRVVEEGSAESVLDNPREARTRQFLQMVEAAEARDGDV